MAEQAKDPQDGAAGRAPRRERRPLAATWALLTVVLVLAAAGVWYGAVEATDDGKNSRDGRGEITLTADQREGRDLFAITCGSCHTLSATRSVGQDGPNLDDLRPPADVVRNVIRTGKGIMPSNLLPPAQAQQVADFVAAVTAY